MKPVPPSPQPPAPESVDRVRLIHRSMRCFVYGLMGVVPLFGLGMACLALLLQRQVSEETGEPAGLAGAKRCSIAALALALALLGCGQAGLVLALGILLCGLQSYLLFRQYQRAEPRQWNPARH